jgi:DNA-binding NarL/FixJ family response regulator
MDSSGPYQSHNALDLAGPSALALPVSVLLLIEVCLYREGLANELARCSSVSVVASTGDVTVALNCARELQPQVVLVGPQVEQRQALVRQLTMVSPGSRVVALGVREVEQEVLPCAELGMAGYVTRDATVEDLIGSIECAARGELRCSPGIAASLFRRIGALSETPRRPPPILTRREEEIARLIDQGLSNKQIARRLRIEVSTVKNHVHSLLKKLHAPRRTAIGARFHLPPPPL